LAVISATSFSLAVVRSRFVVSSAYPAVDASCSVTVPADVSDRCSAAAESGGVPSKFVEAACERVELRLGFSELE
jgi:hypothetical protein